MIQISRAKLNNGLRSLHYYLPSTKSITTSILIKCGSINEIDPQEYGIAHFLEHMTGNETKNFPDMRESNMIAEKYGIIENAWTYKYITAYYAKSSIENFQKAYAILVDRVWFPLLSQKATLKEQGVILQEIGYRDNEPQTRVYDAFEEVIFDYPPLKHDTIGTKQSISDMSSSRLRNFYEKNYIAENMLIFTAGNLKHDKIINELQKVEIGRKEDTNIIYPNSLKNNKRLNFKFIQSDTSLYHCILGINGIKLNDKDLYTLNILKAILGSGKGSLLNLELNINNQLVSSFSVDLLAFPDDGVLMIYFSTEEKLVVKVLQKILTILDGIQKNSISKDSLFRARNIEKSTWLKLSENSDSFIGQIDYFNPAVTELLTGENQSVERIISEIDRTSVEDIRYTLKKRLKDSRIGCALLGKNEKVGKNIRDIIDNY